MKNLTKYYILVILLLSLGLSGCGSDTSGTLVMSDAALTDLTGGSYKVVATATYSPVNGKSPEGDSIIFTAVYTTASGVTPVTRVQEYILSSTGIATFTDLVIQSDEPIYLRLTATHGELSQTKIVTIPTKVAP